MSKDKKLYIRFERTDFSIFVDNLIILHTESTYD